MKPKFKIPANIDISTFIGHYYDHDVYRDKHQFLAVYGNGSRDLVTLAIYNIVDDFAANHAKFFELGASPAIRAIISASAMESLTKADRRVIS